MAISFFNPNPNNIVMISVSLNVITEYKQLFNGM